MLDAVSVELTPLPETGEIVPPGTPPRYVWDIAVTKGVAPVKSLATAIFTHLLALEVYLHRSIGSAATPYLSAAPAPAWSSQPGGRPSRG